jgi:uncharacterized protein YndB with AHSA1/START domain
MAVHATFWLHVWRALSDAKEFGDWFGVNFTDQSFVEGKRAQGKITYPGYEHLVMEVLIERMVPERHLSWRWHPAATDSSVDYSGEPTALVVFELAEGEGGTLRTVAESGFDKLPQARRATALRMNTSTKHLGVLAAAGLVRDVKLGRERLWEFEPASLEEARRSLEAIGQQWDDALARLKIAVES